MSVADDEPVHFNESSGLRPLSGERQTLRQTRAQGHNKCSNCGQHGHNKRSCPTAASGGQAVEGAQNTGKRKQDTPSGSSRLLKASRQNVSSPTSGSSSDEGFQTSRKIDFQTPRNIGYRGSAPEPLPASTVCSFRAGDNGAVTGASGDAQDSCNQCGKSVARCTCTCIVID